MNKEDLLTLAVKLENQRSSAMVTGDVEQLKMYFSEDLFYGHAGGFADNFSSFMERLISGFAKYTSLTTVVHEVVCLGENAFTLNGEVKVEAMINSISVSLHCVYVGVWKMESSQWKFVAHQSAKLPQLN